MLRVEGLSTTVSGDTVSVGLSVYTATDAGFRVRVDLVPGSRRGGSESGALVGGDPEPVVASPIVIVTLLDSFIGL